MKVTIKGKGDVNLTQQDFVAGGGQGKVYAKGDKAFKVYHDASAMMPEGKILELAALPAPPFSRPEDILLDNKGRVIGYTTRFVRDAYVLCQLFPRSFRDREGVTHKHTFALAEKMRDGITAAHKAGILLIDGNEMNFLVDSKFCNLTFIDTDSYQTRNYPAVAIMESVRDRHMKHARDFDEGTDWFSFACVSLQMLIGIHPYKGKHPNLKGFDERMKANVSVFNRDVNVPKAAYPFDVIPPDWRSWYEAVLERGDRCAPPGGTLQVMVIKPVVRTVTGAANLILEEIGSFDGAVTGLWASGTCLVVATDAGLWMDGRRVGDWSGVTAVAFSTRRNLPVATHLPATMPEFYDCIARQPVAFGLEAQRVVGHDGRIYVKSRDKVLEVIVNDMGRVILSTRVAATVLPNASMLFPGGVVQDILGSTFVSLFPDTGKTYQVRIPELDDYRVIDAKWDAGVQGGVLMVIAIKGGQYDRLAFRFNPTFTTYDIRKVEDVGQTGLNFVVTDAGVCICLTETDTLELTSVRIGSNQVKTIADPVLGGDMRLYKRGAQVLVTRGDRVYTMRMT